MNSAKEIKHVYNQISTVLFLAILQNYAREEEYLKPLL